VSQVHQKIKTVLSCPHCWQEFPTDQLLFISESLDLPPDPKLPGDRLRFLPQRFNLAGAALDPHNKPCDKMACPECHLPIPRPWLYLSSFFVSIAGAPASGKSYFLASMIWQLRKTMAKNFCSNFTDADPKMNRRTETPQHLQALKGRYHCALLRPVGARAC
jgi:hypothetical protein